MVTLSYAEEIERSAYNDLLGAQAANGEDWCYYSFPNGKRVHTTYWRCCKSSGAMALEELAGVAYGVSRDGGGVDGGGRVSVVGGVNVNVLGPSEAVLNVADVGAVRIEQRTPYPFDGEVTIRVVPERAASFVVRVRIPEWAEGASVRVNGDAVSSAELAGSVSAAGPQSALGPTAAVGFAPSVASVSAAGSAQPVAMTTPIAPSAPVGAASLAGTYVSIERTWRAGDVITLSLPMRPRVHRRANRNVQESLAPDGSRVSQEVLCFDYLAITRGPLVYATGLIDGYKIEETLRVPPTQSDTWHLHTAHDWRAGGRGRRGSARGSLSRPAIEGCSWPGRSGWRCH